MRSSSSVVWWHARSEAESYCGKAIGIGDVGKREGTQEAAIGASDGRMTDSNGQAADQ